MRKIEIDPRKNRLYLIMDTADKLELKQFVEKIEKVCRSLVPGFSCVVAFTNGGPVKQRDEDLLFHIEDLIYAYGAKKVVRVRKNGNIFDLLSQRTLNMQPTYFAGNAASIEEAEKILDNMKSKRVRETQPLEIFSG